MHAKPYVGRFAPTPSGHLHFGSLLAALASYLDARHHDGRWLVRIEDLDQPRNMPGATDHILSTLESYGMAWDGDILHQSRNLERYSDLLHSLIERGEAYYCDCSRKLIMEQGGLYPGFCRTRALPAGSDHAIRVRVPDQQLRVSDRLQGTFSQNLASDVGDFVVRRRDGIVAYQFAVVVDDIDQGITDIVRGADLLDSTPRQLWLYHLLDATPPCYLHIPLIMRRQGEKLSKRLASEPIETGHAPATLFRALTALGQQPPHTLRNAPVSEQLAWAAPHWQPQRLPAVQQMLEESLPPT
ncbi:tRNA glutamyl-Q(34) synthetase GluQRS [Pseudomonas sp. gcc21]|uniref:tRNA glutamyl-Q(34) synthetase GluQRS n=1 Tax=Pseudomonas sp. gcc21 TaxID=2726989 RepID=UPI001451F0AC|nr:tRNA glutamyl-Q(34) synthetase GluQRS [Pseudomonas sp. gcc21]QJD60283.1 tRNA glutamyl-Q(34) synthetase GluQRS [Pseudomonas sp. gcc21]